MYTSDAVFTENLGWMQNCAPNNKLQRHSIDYLLHRYTEVFQHIQVALVSVFCIAAVALFAPPKSGKHCSHYSNQWIPVFLKYFWGSTRLKLTDSDTLTGLDTQKAFWCATTCQLNKTGVMNQKNQKKLWLKRFDFFFFFFSPVAFLLKKKKKLKRENENEKSQVIKLYRWLFILSTCLHWQYCTASCWMRYQK